MLRFALVWSVTLLWPDLIVAMKDEPEKLLNKCAALVHSEEKKVTSHVQREEGEWILNTLMLDGCDVPFRYKRKKRYKNLRGQRVNLTYYPMTEVVGGLDFEVMKVVRVRIS